MDLSIDDAMKRGEWGAERYEKEDMQRRVRSNFHALREYEQTLPEGVRVEWRVVDASGSPEEVAARVDAEVDGVVERVALQQPALQQLWMADAPIEDGGAS
eukprot:scaffold1245_cov252-Pinguiococcus_pyrenoidosus.AAC.8